MDPRSEEELREQYFPLLQFRALGAALLTLAAVAYILLTASHSATGQARASVMPKESSTRLPPRARTAKAYGVHGSDAVLVAIVNPRNQRTAVRFQYGLDRHYGSIAPKELEEVAVGGHNQEINQAVRCLAPKTTYHFRVVASNRSGTTYGADRTFTTTRLHSPKSQLYRHCPRKQ